MDVEIRDGELHLDGRVHALKGVRLAVAEHRPPRIGLFILIASVCGAVVIPVVVAALSRTEHPRVEATLHAILAVTALTFFGTIARVLYVRDRYCVVLEGEGANRTALESDDPQLVVSVVARINDGLGAGAAPRGARILPFVTR